MSKIGSYLGIVGRRMLAQMAEARARLTASEVRGEDFEEIVASFFREHYPAWFIATRSQVIDSFDNISGSVDVVICNSEQPFRVQSAATLIAEGVDFVVQVKATLTTSELDKSLSNCQTIKDLRKYSNRGDRLGALPTGFNMELLSRVPYVVFAFSTNIGKDTLRDRLNAAFESGDPCDGPDVVFVLDKGWLLVNFRNGDSWVNWSHDDSGQLVRWSRFELGDQGLPIFLSVVSSVPRQLRFTRPIVNYTFGDGFYMEGGAGTTRNGPV